MVKGEKVYKHKNQTLDFMPINLKPTQVYNWVSEVIGAASQCRVY